MKVLILGSKEYPFGKSDDKLPSGGMESYVQDLAKHLIKLKIQPIIVTRKFENLKSHEIISDAEVHRVNWMRGFLFRGPSFNLFSFFKALNLDYDVILTNGIMATLFGCLLRSLKNKPIVAIPHGFAHTQKKYGPLAKILHLLEKNIYAKVKVIALSPNEAKKLKELGLKDVVIIPTPVDASRFNPNKASKQVTICFVGRLAQVKGVEYFLKAIPKLQRNPKILIAGSGADEGYYHKIAPKNADFLGFIEPTEVFNKSNIFVLPSLSEGLPISLLEAMAAGCACVVTDIGLPVKNKENALVVPPANSEKLAEAINLLIKNKKLREKLGAAARKYVKQFSWDKAALQFKELFLSL